MAWQGVRSGFAAHMSIHAPLPERWTPWLQKIKDFCFLMLRSNSFKPLCTERTYVSPDPAPLHTYVRTYVRTRTHVRCNSARTYVHTLCLVGPAVSEVPGGEEGNWLEWEPRS